MKKKHRKFPRSIWMKSRKKSEGATSTEWFKLDKDEILAGPPEERGSYNFLGNFPPRVVDHYLQKHKIYRHLNELGYEKLNLTVDTRDAYRQRLAVYFDSADPKNLLIEVVLRRHFLTLKSPFPHPAVGCNFEFLAVEWLCLQNPGKEFSPEYPRLPGQSHPGLGMGKLALILLMDTAKRMKLAGILNVPEHFHNSHLYARKMSYLKPEAEGKRIALARDLLGELTLCQLSWAIDQNCVLENNKSFVWFVSEQILPIDSLLVDFLRCEEYQQRVARTGESVQYRLKKRKWKQIQTKLKLF